MHLIGGEELRLKQVRTKPLELGTLFRSVRMKPLILIPTPKRNGLHGKVRGQCDPNLPPLALLKLVPRSDHRPHRLRASNVQQHHCATISN